MVTNPAVRHGACFLFGDIIGFMSFSILFLFYGGLVPPGQFHQAPCTRCKLPAFTAAHAFSVSLQFSLAHLKYFFIVFSNPVVIPNSSAFFASHSQDSVSYPFWLVLFCAVVSSGLVLILMLASFLLIHTYTESRTLSRLKKIHTVKLHCGVAPSHSFSVKHSKRLQVPCSKRHCSIRSETVLSPVTFSFLLYPIFCCFLFLHVVAEGMLMRTCGST